MIYESLEQREEILTRELNKVIPLAPHDREDWHTEATCKKMVDAIPVRKPIKDADGEVIWKDEAALDLVRKTADMWFQDSRPSGKARKVGHAPVEAEAADICFSCPVRRECLKYATDTKQEFGTWGGIPAVILIDNKFDYPTLVNMKNPFDTEDTESPFHRSNIRISGLYKDRTRKAA